MDLRDLFDTSTPLVGMVHLPALPGAPRHEQPRDDIRARALADAHTLARNGLDGILVENFGDAPFYPDGVPKHVVAEMTATARELSLAVDVPLGVNVLRNDAEAALSVAAAAGGSFMRVNVHTGASVTDQGVLDGSAHETLRLRDQLDADVAILADVDVKHATPLGERDRTALVRETIDRGLADAVVVSGPETGKPADNEDLRMALDGRDDATRDVPVFVGSGVTPENVSALLDDADGAIVGTALKKQGQTTNRVDPDRVATLVEAARAE
ncbi:BtpA/SgcQ family protein [Halovenus salina]|uniref:BtpA/SgcQ family protein n=1 Tax=Halovenus salina TaxID=1510225 RepID=A0ABD5VXD0_9EURY|nr:BtpA/SgcQ family protein [Halovenus salina]